MVGCLGLGAKLRDLEISGSEVEVHIPFEATDWLGLSLSIPRTGVLGNGQIGPHQLPLGQYDVTVTQLSALGWERDVKVEVRQNRLTGEIRLTRSARLPAFDGYIVIDWAKDYST